MKQGSGAGAAPVAAGDPGSAAGLLGVLEAGQGLAAAGQGDGGAAVEAGVALPVVQDSQLGACVKGRGVRSRWRRPN